jgi:hypothetical protein
MGFFPAFPFRIPYSPGLPGWWDIAWWTIQIIVMLALLSVFQRAAHGVDRLLGLEERADPREDERAE